MPLIPQRWTQCTRSKIEKARWEREIPYRGKENSVGVISQGIDALFGVSFRLTAYFFKPPHEGNEENPEDRDDDSRVYSKKRGEGDFPQRAPSEKIPLDQGMDFRVDTSSGEHAQAEHPLPVDLRPVRLDYHSWTGTNIIRRTANARSIQSFVLHEGDFSHPVPALRSRMIRAAIFAPLPHTPGHP
jgi:hypothetical protein